MSATHLPQDKDVAFDDSVIKDKLAVLRPLEEQLYNRQKKIAGPDRRVRRGNEESRVEDDAHKDRVSCTVSSTGLAQANRPGKKVGEGPVESELSELSSLSEDSVLSEKQETGKKQGVKRLKAPDSKTIPGPVNKRGRRRTGAAASGSRRPTTQSVTQDKGASQGAGNFKTEAPSLVATAMDTTSTNDGTGNKDASGKFKIEVPTSVASAISTIPTKDAAVTEESASDAHVPSPDDPMTGIETSGEHTMELSHEIQCELV
ncbi:hypothetical protein AAF712_010420 [Marasmius tenuissimus]|uniref:Uncharacterized protein n=1 Tax=Marasmius tenuissimus TaxID=585030 RepID=A0ABR2ZN33_9AGAR